jgi:hypothetical protein
MVHAGTQAFAGLQPDGPGTDKRTRTRTALQHPAGVLILTTNDRSSQLAPS